MSEVLKSVLMAEAVAIGLSAMLIFGTIGKIRKRKACTARTVGVITEIICENHARSSNYHLRVRFDADNAHMNAVEPCDCAPRAFSVGEHVEVCYDPADPRNFYVVGNDRNNVNVSLGIAVAVAIPIVVLCIVLKAVHGG